MKTEYFRVKGLHDVTSALRNPLPLEEYASDRVATYFYSGRWIFIKSYTLADAIALHRAVKRAGTEIYIFLPDIDPNHFNNFDVLLLLQEPSISVPVEECFV